MIDTGVTGQEVTKEMWNQLVNGINYAGYNASTGSQSVPATTRTHISGTKLLVPSTSLLQGTILEWQWNMTKTAAGSAASTIDVSVGANGTTADTARLSFTKPAGTASADEAWCRVRTVVRTAGASGVLVGEFVMVHNGNTAGHATIPVVVVNTVSSAVDLTGAPYLSVNITTGTSDAITIQLATAQAFNIV